MSIRVRNLFTCDRICTCSLYITTDRYSACIRLRYSIILIERFTNTCIKRCSKLCSSACISASCCDIFRKLNKSISKLLSVNHISNHCRFLLIVIHVALCTRNFISVLHCVGMLNTFLCPVLCVVQFECREWEYFI